MTSRTVLFFGSFNPIHRGHLQIARYMLDGGYGSRVWFVVSPQNPWKADAGLLEEERRLEMVRRAIAGDARMEACDVEFSMPRPSYTYHTLCALRERYPGMEFALAIGGDNLERFPEWRQAEDILTEFPVLVYPRPGARIPSWSEGRVTVVDAPQTDISSTEIRRKVRAGEPLTGEVPPAIRGLVEKYYRRQ